MRGTYLGEPIFSNKTIPRKGTKTKTSRVISKLRMGEPKMSDIIEHLDEVEVAKNIKRSLGEHGSHKDVNVLEDDQLYMGELDSTKEFKVEKNTV